MNNTIMIGSSMSYLNSGTSSKKTTASTGNAYLDILKSLQGEKTGIEVSASPEDMTMEEYKAYIAERLQQLPMDSSRSDGLFSVVISDAGWERMKSDSTYEQWVLNTMQSNLATPDPWAQLGSSSYGIYRFGATQEEYTSDTWGKDYPGDVKSYLTSELLGIGSSKSKSTGNLLLNLAYKKQKSANNQSIQQLAKDIARLQQLNLLTAGRGTSANSAQNAAFLLNALNSYMR